MKKYELIKDDISIKTEVYYNKGGMNYFTGRNEERGYYMSICPVKKTQIGNVISETYTAFSGVKILLLTVNRKSDKAYNLAVELSKEKEAELRKIIINKI